MSKQPHIKRSNLSDFENDALQASESETVKGRGIFSIMNLVMSRRLASPITNLVPPTRVPQDTQTGFITRLRCLIEVSRGGSW